MGPHRPLTSLNDYGWWNPILIDKLPQPFYRLNYNTYINRLQPDHLVEVSGGLNHTTKCATWKSHDQSHRDAPSCTHLRATWCIKDRQQDHNQAIKNPH